MKYEYEYDHDISRRAEESIALRDARAHTVRADVVGSQKGNSIAGLSCCMISKS